jgi:hypothetical protein
MFAVAESLVKDTKRDGYYEKILSLFNEIKRTIDGKSTCFVTDGAYSSIVGSLSKIEQGINQFADDKEMKDANQAVATFYKVIYHIAQVKINLYQLEGSFTHSGVSNRARLEELSQLVVDHQAGFFLSQSCDYFREHQVPQETVELYKLRSQIVLAECSKNLCRDAADIDSLGQAVTKCSTVLTSEDAQPYKIEGFKKLLERILALYEDNEKTHPALLAFDLLANSDKVSDEELGAIILSQNDKSPNVVQDAIALADEKLILRVGSLLIKAGAEKEEDKIALHLFLRGLLSNSRFGINQHGLNFSQTFEGGKLHNLVYGDNGLKGIFFKLVPERKDGELVKLILSTLLAADKAGGEKFLNSIFDRAANRTYADVTYIKGTFAQIFKLSFFKPQTAALLAGIEKDTLLELELATPAKDQNRGELVRAELLTQLAQEASYNPAHIHHIAQLYYGRFAALNARCISAEGKQSGAQAEYAKAVVASGIALSLGSEDKTQAQKVLLEFEKDATLQHLFFAYLKEQVKTASNLPRLATFLAASLNRLEKEAPENKFRDKLLEFVSTSFSINEEKAKTINTSNKDKAAYLEAAKILVDKSREAQLIIAGFNLVVDILQFVKDAPAGDALIFLDKKLGEAARDGFSEVSNGEVGFRCLGLAEDCEGPNKLFPLYARICLSLSQKIFLCRKNIQKNIGHFAKEEFIDPISDAYFTLLRLERSYNAMSILDEVEAAKRILPFYERFWISPFGSLFPVSQ